MFELNKAILGQKVIYHLTEKDQKYLNLSQKDVFGTIVLISNYPFITKLGLICDDYRYYLKLDNIEKIRKNLDFLLKRASQQENLHL